MYLEYYGLREPPFSITPDPRYVFLSERHRDALAHLLYGIGKGGSGGFVQLTGEVGTGKTTLCRLLLEQLPENTRVALVLNPKLSPVELVESVCEELKLDISGRRGSLKASDRYVECVSARCVCAGFARRADRRRGAEPFDRFAGAGAPSHQSRDADAETAADHSARPAGTSRRARRGRSCASSRSASPRAIT